MSPSSAPRARYLFGQGTSAGTRGDGRDAPLAIVDPSKLRTELVGLTAPHIKAT